jgi:CHASE2 domain-containing sensor protein
VSATLHGRPGLALRAQPAGMVLVAAAAVSVVLGAAQLVRPGTLPKRFRPRLSWLLAALGVLLLGWACAMLTGVIEGRFPTH